MVSLIQLPEGFTISSTRQILHVNRINNVAAEETASWLSDHYSPTERALHLSAEVYHGRSIVSTGIAAH